MIGQFYLWNTCEEDISLKSMILSSSLLQVTDKYEDYEARICHTSDLMQLQAQPDTLIILLMLTELKNKEQAAECAQELIKRGFEMAVIVDPVLEQTQEFAQFLSNSGIPRCIVPLDAAGKKLFRTRHQSKDDGQWETYLAFIKAIVESSKIYVQLFAGMGETEEQFAQVCQLLHDAGSNVVLFSLENNSLVGRNPPSIGRYRRMQLISFLIEQELVTWRQMRFNEFGSIYDFGVHPQKVEEIISGGKPFCCPDDFSYWWPGHDNNETDIRNFVDLSSDAISRIRKQLISIDWSEEWRVAADKFRIEEVDFSEIEEDNDLSAMIRAGNLSMANISTDDLRYLNNK